MQKKKSKVSDMTRLRSAVRKVWQWSIVRREALAKARLSKGIYRCNSCEREDVRAQEIKVDHIEPFAPLHGLKNLADWGDALVRLFDPDNHQALCESCHDIKTQIENLARKNYRKSGSSL